MEFSLTFLKFFGRGDIISTTWLVHGLHLISDPLIYDLSCLTLFVLLGD